MSYLRKPVSEITPEYEDAGLFKNELCQVIVELVPQMSRTGRGDLRVRGFVNGTLEIEVLFAGRRASELNPLESRLRCQLAKTRRSAASANQPTPAIDTIRYPVRIEGAWRPKFRRDPAGWETRSYHLVAARWAMVDVNGDSVSFGMPPAV